MTNHDQHVSAEIEVQISRGNELEGSVFNTTYLRNLTLSKNARKQFRFSVLLDNFAKPLVVRGSKADQEIARRTLDLRRHFTESKLIVVLSRDADLDYLNYSSPHHLRVVYPHPELLPEKWQGYDGVSAVVVHEQSLERLSKHQYEALRKWLIQGGNLVVSGSPNYSLLRTPRLSALLPAKPVGLVAMIDGEGLGTAFGLPLTANKPFVINRVDKLRGTTIHQFEDIRLLLARDYGMGTVSYFTFDVAAYPFDRWSGMTSLWRKVFNLSAVDRGSVALHQSPDSPIPSMSDEPNRGFPDHLVVFIFLMIYLGAKGRDRLAVNLDVSVSMGGLIRIQYGEQNCFPGQRFAPYTLDPIELIIQGAPTPSTAPVLMRTPKQCKITTVPFPIDPGC